MTVLRKPNGWCRGNIAYYICVRTRFIIIPIIHVCTRIPEPHNMYVGNFVRPRVGYNYYAVDPNLQHPIHKAN